MRRISMAAALLAFFGAVHAADESFPKVSRLPSHPELPDPLVTFNGERVTTKEQWFKMRRPELKALFEHYMYGVAPPAPEKVDARVERTDPRAFDGKATLKEITLSFGPSGAAKIHLLLVVPNERKGPAPVFAGMNFCGNHAVVKDPAVRLPAAWMYDNQPGV